MTDDRAVLEVMNRQQRAQYLVDHHLRMELALGACSILLAAFAGLLVAFVNVSRLVLPLVVCSAGVGIERAVAWKRNRDILRRAHRAWASGFGLPPFWRFDPRPWFELRGYTFESTPTRDPVFRLLMSLPVPAFVALSMGFTVLVAIVQLWFGWD